MSEAIHKSHNVSIVLYHFVCPAKYRRVVFDKVIDVTLKAICVEIALRYDLIFLEIGVDGDHVHFLIQSIPRYSPSKLIQMIKSVTAREIFKRHPQVKERLWGGEFWSDGYYVATVGQYGSETTIREYVRKQGTENDYHRLHRQQLALF